MLHAIASMFIGAVLAVGAFFSVYHEPQVASLPELAAPTLGASLPSGTAVFETSLASRISSTDTSLTLVANSVRGGSTLSGYQCFTIDEGRTDAEYVCGSVSGTSVTSLTRGIDPSTGTTTNSALKFAHRVGANVKITDFPLIQILRNQANGTDTYPNSLSYADSVATTSLTNPQHLVSKALLDYTAFNGAGVVDGTTLAKGVLQLATQIQTASSTAAGSSGNLAIPASNATSTCNGSTSALRVLVSDNSGYLDDDCLPSTITKNLTLSGTVNFTGTVDGADGNKYYVNLAPTAVTTNASTTVFVQPVTANTLSTANYLKTTVYMKGVRLSDIGTCASTFEIGYGSASTTFSFPSAGVNARSVSGTAKFEIILAANGATNSQKLSTMLSVVATTSGAAASSTSAYATTAGSVDSTTAKNITMITKSDVTAGCFFEADMVISELYN